MKIGELARRTGVSRDTIRFYERQGLLPKPLRTPSGYRDFPDAAADDLTFIRKAKALGLKLTEVREILTIAAGGVTPCDHVRDLVQDRLDEVDRRLVELDALRSSLVETLERLDGSAPSPEPGCRCAAIELS